MKYDLHIHSALSPCAEDEMSPNNIVQMAKLHALDLISVCDHNSTLQQALIAKIASKNALQYWFGIELTSKEDVHVLAYFKNIENIHCFQKQINPHYQKIENKVEIFGHQILFDEHDRSIDEVNFLLLTALDLSLENCIHLIHQNHGKAVLAHIYSRENGVIQQLGFIPENLSIDGVEVVHNEDIARFKNEYPRYINLPIFMNSDAHRLSEMIHDYHDLPVEANWFKK